MSIDLKFIEIIFGGFTGAFLTYLLSSIKDKKNKKQQIDEINILIKSELSNILSFMENESGMKKYNVTGYELLKQRGLLSLINYNHINDIVEIYIIIDELNDIVDSYRIALQGYMAANNLKNFHASDFMELYNPVKEQGLSKIKLIIPKLG